MRFFKGITILEKVYLWTVLTALGTAALFEVLYLTTLAITADNLTSANLIWGLIVAGGGSIFQTLFAVALWITGPVAAMPDIWRAITRHASPRFDWQIYARISFYLLVSLGSYLSINAFQQSN